MIPPDANFDFDYIVKMDKIRKGQIKNED